MKVFDQFLLSYQLMIGNISPQDTKSGAIVAAISKQSPNYWYTWTRDAALTMDVVNAVYKFTKYHPELNLVVGSKQQLDKFFDDYAAFTYSNQRTQTPSAQYDDSNLGEPKFNVDGSAFTGPWGRPQNDGPALRSYALINYLLDSNRQTTWYTSSMNSIIKMDCEYLAKKLNAPSFDLWEEVLGMHFYNAVVYDKSLEACAAIATANNDPGAATYYNHKRNIAQQNIQSHMTGNYVQQTLEKRGGVNKPSNLDIATVLAILHTNVGPQDVVYASHPKVQATVVMLQKAFYNVYPLNSDPGRIKEAEQYHLGYAFGRYPEDTYDGYGTSKANPWFLATASVAEYYYLLIAEYQSLQRIEINDLNREFFTTGLDLKIANGVIDGTHADFKWILNRLFEMGDKQLRRMMYHGTCRNTNVATGHFSEQFNLNSGFMQGAKDLTWSHASFLTATMKRTEAANVLGINVTVSHGVEDAVLPALQPQRAMTSFKLQQPQQLATPKPAFHRHSNRITAMRASPAKLTMRKPLKPMIKQHTAASVRFAHLLK